MVSHIAHFKSITELSEAIRGKDVSPVEVTRTYLDRIRELNGTLGSYITVMEGAALAQAAEAARSIEAGDYRSPLHGIPVAIKDIIYTRGVLTSAGSRVLNDHVPDKDSTIVERLNRAGAVLLGKLNLSEFATGGTIEHPYGTPRNPWDTGRSPGGSSSGSGVAVAAGLCAGTLGSDTGGSIRGPSHLCGIVGIRPTYGRVTRHGVVPMAWSLDTVGPMTRTVRDCALMLGAIAGRDPRDPTSSSQPVPDYAASMDGGIRGLRIALIREMFDFEGLDGEVRGAVQRAIVVLDELGASSGEVSLPMVERSPAVFIAVADVEAASFHSRWLAERGDEYDWSTRMRLEAATLIPASVHLKAQRARAALRREMLDVLDRFDAIIVPTGPGPAPPLESSTGRRGGYYQGKADLGRRMYTSPAALAGLPALSVPCGFTESGLPMGMQIIGRPFDETTLFRLGHAYEGATEWHTMHPEL